MLPASDERIISRPLRIPPGERWCGGCGADVPAGRFDLENERHNSKRCPFCGSYKLFQVEAVLRPDEYYIAQ